MVSYKALNTNKKFIVDSIITDYRLGKQEIRLIEKK